MQTTHTQCRLFSIRLASDEDESKVEGYNSWSSRTYNYNYSSTGKDLTNDERYEEYNLSHNSFDEKFTSVNS